MKALEIVDPKCCSTSQGLLLQLMVSLLFALVVLSIAKTLCTKSENDTERYNIEKSIMHQKVRKNQQPISTIPAYKCNAKCDAFHKWAPFKTHNIEVSAVHINALHKIK